jgi:hypothetical protein
MSRYFIASYAYGRYEQTSYGITGVVVTTGQYPNFYKLRDEINIKHKPCKVVAIFNIIELNEQDYNDFYNKPEETNL